MRSDQRAPGTSGRSAGRRSAAVPTGASAAVDAFPRVAPADMADVRVVGIGGAGCNAINRMIEVGVAGVQFVAMNTDAQSLGRCFPMSVNSTGEPKENGTVGILQPSPTSKSLREKGIKTLTEDSPTTSIKMLGCGMPSEVYSNSNPRGIRSLWRRSNLRRKSLNASALEL